MIIFSSGTTEIILKTRNTLSNLSKRKLELFGIGIKDMQTIKVSKTKHFDFFQFFLGLVSSLIKIFGFLIKKSKRSEITFLPNDFDLSTFG